jgi:hypothetical protein
LASGVARLMTTKQFVIKLPGPMIGGTIESLDQYNADGNSLIDRMRRTDGPTDAR